MQQFNIKPVSLSFKQKALRSKKLCIGFNFKHEYAKMSQRAEDVNNSGNDGQKLLRVLAFIVSVGERFYRKEEIQL